MERNFSYYNLHWIPNMKKSRHNDHSEKPDHLDEDNVSPSFNLQNVSKLILPPLGVSSYNQNPVETKGWIISPMDTRYR